MEETIKSLHNDIYAEVLTLASNHHEAASIARRWVRKLEESVYVDEYPDFKCLAIWIPITAGSLRIHGSIERIKANKLPHRMSKVFEP